MRCCFCGFDYDEELARRGCSGCSFSGGCGLVKCPRCGYESPRESGFIKFLRGVLGKEKKK